MRIVANFRNYGQGLIEAGWAYVPDLANCAPKRKRGESADRDINQDRAARRAKSQVRRKIMVAHLDYLLTLTFRGNVDDYSVASKCLVEFVRLVHEKYPEWKYLAVPERQARGCWHWHLAVSGWQNVVLLRHFWRKVTPDRQGNIDVRTPSGAKRLRWGRLKLAYYLGKYITKNIQETELNKQSYRTAHDMDTGEVQRFTLPGVVKAREWVLSKMRALARVGYVYESADKCFGWVSSWELKPVLNNA